MTKRILYINKEYGNEATLDATMDNDIASFGNITWKTLLTEVKSESLDWLLKDENLINYFGIEPNQLDELIGPETIDRYYSDIEFHVGNYEGAEAAAFNFIGSLNIFPTDIDGNGASNGVWLQQTYADGPRKTVLIEDETAAEWLRQRFKEKGVDVEIKFI
ncbi:MAG: hypothetical protein ACOYMG_19345 [Candidatus Methylumidiphilus sp.]